MSALIPSVDSFSSYMNTIRDIPLISEEEELKLALDYFENGNAEAARKLTISHLRFVVFMVRKYDGYGLPIADMVQEGNLGLIKAVQRFDPHQGVRLMAFAGYWIRAELNNFVINNLRIVRLATTKTQRKLFFKLRSQKKEGNWFSADEVAHIAKELNVKEDDVRQMESRLMGQEVYLGPSTHDGNDDDEYGGLEAVLEGPNEIDDFEEAQFEQHQKLRLAHAVRSLTEREQEVIKRRWIQDDKGTTLGEIATDFGLSVERIRQIEKAAITKLKQQLAA